MFDDLKDFAKTISIKIALLFVVFFIGGIGLGIYTEKTLESKTHAVTTMYVVKDGDTLIDICWEYQKLDCRKPYILEFVDEIKNLNPNLSKYLQVGDEIKIKYLVAEENVD